MPDLGVHQPQPDRQLPAAPVPLEPAGHENFKDVAIVLPQAVDTLFPEPPGNDEGTRDIGGKPLHQALANESLHDEFRVEMKPADAGPRV